MMESVAAKPSDRPAFLQKMLREGARKTGSKTFIHNYPLTGFPAKIILPINPNIKVINGVYGDEPTKFDIWAQGELLESRWGARDGGLSKYEYDKKLELRYRTFHTPAFSGCISERPCALILPVQVGSIPRTSQQLADERIWNKDDPQGRKLMVDQLVSEKAGLAEMVIGAYLAYARILRRMGIIDEVVGFTRPKNIAKWIAQNQELLLSMGVIRNTTRFTQPSDISKWLSENPRFSGKAKKEIAVKYFYSTGDNNILLHLRLGAKMEQVYPDGCPNYDLALGIMIRMNYTHMLG